MLPYLQQLSDPILWMSVLLCALSISTLLPALLRWIFNWHPSETLGKGAFDAFKLVAPMALLIFAFSLVRVQGDHRNVEDLVTKEAALVLKLDSALESFGDDLSENLREDLKNYVYSISADEWPLMQKSQSSEDTANLLTDLTQGIRLLTPENATQQMMRVEINVTLNQLTDVRQARLAATKVKFPSYLYQALAASMATLVVLGWFQTPLSRMIIYVGGVTVGFSLLFVLLVQSSGIFIGDNRVTSTEFVKTTQQRLLY